jgi:hypothetical protein
MSAETQTAKDQTSESRCWCCGQIRPEDALVHLGNHPEVGICINCVHFLGRRARDSRGWHQRPVVGPALQWLNRHLPW